MTPCTTTSTCATRPRRRRIRSTARSRWSRRRPSRSRASTSTSPAQASAASPSTAARPTFRRDGEELVITPRKAIRGATRSSSPSRSTWRCRRSRPRRLRDDRVLRQHSAGSATAGQPNLAHYFLPSNDHPSDKASFDIRFDVPAGKTAVANGVQAGALDRHGRSHFVYVQRQPMATELIQLAVGDLDVIDARRHAGVLLRDVTARPITARIEPLLAVTPAQMDWMQDARRALPVRPLRLARGRGRPRLRAGDADARADRHVAGSTTSRRTCGTRRCCTRCRTCGSATASRRDLERPLAQRGPRELVRVPLRRGERLPRGRHRGLPGRQRLRDASTS